MTFVYLQTGTMNYDITIDGSMGEGGGQVLRTAMTLSCILGKSLRIFNVRAKRENPGLQKQHVMSLFAAAHVCNGVLTGCTVGSSEFTFIPGKIVCGDFTFDIQSAGSSILVLQTVIPILWFASGPSTIRVKGGTHNGLSPSFDFYKEVFCPLMPVYIDSQLIRYGFYPAGGGEVFAKVDPSVKRNGPLLLMDRGTLSYKQMIMIHSKAENACNKINERLRTDLKCNPIEVQASGKGLPVLSAFYKFTNFAEMINVYHQKDVPRTVSAFTTLVDEYQKSTAPVEEHLADQLLLPLALIGGGTYRAISLSKHSKHFETNSMIIHMFLGPRIYVSQVTDGYEVRVV
jgi:RNA 3'-terminal phosphate cyclase (ATP)